MSYLKSFLMYFFVAVVSLLGPLFFKEILTGSSGLNTMLLVVFVTGPAGLLFLGFMQGRKETIIHISLFLCANSYALFIWLSQDVNPWKDFVNSFSTGLFIAFSMALAIKFILIKFPSAFKRLS